ncbi:uncharacterized protein LOC105438078 [Strongylocentrotus purpuratus]|uniref:Myb/SANT-like DNA-binding domain-containing protein n=1 Tax=Strongylocentrotus purpuratus TaxID=7668 RepID=A0A7M7PHL5_STRPU|nr:uncharacterized protein LOC105438078 [Strongylocentrotus purpuratus]
MKKSSSKSAKDLSNLPEAWHRHYTDQERRILVQLVLDRIDIIEQNMKDQYTLECKQKAWTEVVQRFNADVRCNHQRDIRQIKKFWDNIKTRAKRMVTDQRLQKTMSGELSAATSAAPLLSEDGTDLDALAEDSIAEKVIYFMKFTACQHHTTQMSNNSFEGDDDEEEENMQIYTESEYESMVRSEGDVIVCDDEPQSGPPAPKRYVLESRSFRDPPLPFPGPAAETSEFMGTGGYMEQSRDSSSSIQVTASSQHEVAQPSFSGHQHSTSAPANGTASRVTMATNSVTTPSYDGGWVVENSVNSNGSRSGPSATAAAKSSPRGNRQTIKKLRKEEYELRIRKLRLDVKYARIEHDERLMVIRAQRELLDSLKPNPLSIISSLFK